MNAEAPRRQCASSADRPLSRSRPSPSPGTARSRPAGANAGARTSNVSCAEAASCRSTTRPPGRTPGSATSAAPGPPAAPEATPRRQLPRTVPRPRAGRSGQHRPPLKLKIRKTAHRSSGDVRGHGCGLTGWLGAGPGPGPGQRRTRRRRAEVATRSSAHHLSCSANPIHPVSSNPARSATCAEAVLVAR